MAVLTLILILILISVHLYFHEVQIFTTFVNDLITCENLSTVVSEVCYEFIVFNNGASVDACKQCLGLSLRSVLFVMS